jgi:hypothetical protein
MYLGYSDLWGFPYTDLRSPAAMLAPYRAQANNKDYYAGVTGLLS